MARTTEFSLGDTVTWSISGVSESSIHCDPVVQDNGPQYERLMCSAPIKPGATVSVDVAVDNPPWVGLEGPFPTAEKYDLAIGIPYKGMRYMARKIYYYDPGFDKLNIRHATSFSPYQAKPAYIDNRHQPDKWIQIQVVHWEYELGFVFRYIWIIPDSVIGYGNSEQNGLPIFARTEPDVQIEEPDGCNGCADMGLPGYTVNMFTLRPVIRDTVFSWQSLGPDVELNLTWNAGLAAGRTDFGSGWRFSYDSWLTESAAGVTLERDDGGVSFFALPPEGNRNVSEVTSTDRDTQVTLEYSDDPLVPAYSDDWDGQFEPDGSGYRLKKVLDGDPSQVSFILTPPGVNQSHLYQRTVSEPGPVPLMAIEDWNSNRLSIIRDGTGAITSITDAAGRQAVLSYNGSGQCSGFTVPGGFSAAFSYAGENLLGAIDLIGNQTAYAYDSRQRVTSMATEGRVWRFAWIDDPEKSYLTSITDADNTTTSYEVAVEDFAFFKTRSTDGDGRSVEYQFPGGRYQTDSRERRPALSYDAAGKIIAISEKGDFNSSFRSFTYNDQGLVERIVENDLAEHHYTYNDRGQVTSYQDALGGTHTNEYDASGNLTRRISPAGRETRYVHDSRGQVVEEIDPEGNRIFWSYDLYGNMATMTDAGGAITRFGYDPAGINLTSITDPSGNTTTMSYDANRRLLRTTFPDDTFTERTYDGFAQSGYRNEAGAYRSVTRSPTLRVLSESDYLGNTRTMEYDTAGRMTRAIDPAGHATLYSYNALGQPESVTDALDERVSWQYYSNTDNFSRHTLTENPEVTVELDSGWYGVSRVDGRQYSRDLMGRLTQVITPRDYWKRLTFTRDADGFILAKNFNGQPLATFVRDGTGRIVSSTHALGTESYSRNHRGQVVEQSWFDGSAAQFAYDLNGNLSLLTYPDGSEASYSYDARGRVSAIHWKGATLQMTYDPIGNIAAEHRTNGHSTTLTSDANGNLTGVLHADSTRTLLELLCQRDARGLLSSCSKEGVLPWSPVLVPDTVTTDYTYNRSFTITSRQGEAATTDPNGNQATLPGDRAFAGVYDYQNLLTDWTAYGVASSAVYDGRNRLIRWTRNGWVRHFHYDDQDRLLFESDEGGTVTAQWLYRGAQVVAMADGNGLYWYHGDLHGNVAYLSDTSGKIVAEYRYMPYGRQRGSFSSVDNPFTFVGSYGVLDLGDGLHYMRSRTYDAESRAFLANDPLGLGIDLNARAYARNNPVNFIDPDGLASFPFGSEQLLYPGADGLGSTTPPRAPTLRQMRGLPPQPSSMKVDPCIVPIAWNTAGSIKGKYGTSAGVLQVLDLMAQGEYGDAILQAGSVGVGAVSRVGGAFLMFMSPSRPDGFEDDRLRHQYPEAYQNTGKISYVSSEPYQFTLPEFSLDN